MQSYGNVNCTTRMITLRLSIEWYSVKCHAGSLQFSEEVQVITVIITRCDVVEWRALCFDVITVSLESCCVDL